MDSNVFYRSLASDYDELFEFERRFHEARVGLEPWATSLPSPTALDLACGTGVQALALAALGLQVTGMDASREMLDRARARADRMGLRVAWIEARMERLGSVGCGPFGGALCLGNSLPHVLETGGLEQTLEGLFRVLEPGGRVTFQLLNYHRILASRQRLLSARRKGCREYLRFYDFLDERIRFNLLTLEWEGERARHRWSSTELRPYVRDDLVPALVRQGFQEIRVHGSLTGESFRPGHSTDLVIHAIRPES